MPVMNTRTAILSRTSVPGRDVYGGCDECGKTPRTLYIYGTIPYLPYSPRHFCNIRCHDKFMAS